MWFVHSMRLGRQEKELVCCYACSYASGGATLLCLIWFTYSLGVPTISRAMAVSNVLFPD